IRAGLDNLSQSERENYKYVRELAANYLMNAGSSENLIDINVSVPVQFRYDGAPIFNLEKTNGQLRVVNRELTSRELEEVVDAGYVQNGEAFTGKVKDVKTHYLPKTSEKVPVIVFKYRGKNVAFP